MRVLLSTYGSRGDVEPMVGLAAQVRALGAEMPVCAPPDFGAHTGTVAAAAEESDALVAGGMMSAMPAGGWL